MDIVEITYVTIRFDFVNIFLPINVISIQYFVILFRIPHGWGAAVTRLERQKDKVNRPEGTPARSRPQRTPGVDL